MPCRFRAVLTLCAVLPLAPVVVFAQEPAPSAVTPVRKGPGVVMPGVKKDAKPSYTAEAMQMKAEGSIVLEAVVLADGKVGSVQAVRCDVKSLRAVEAVGVDVQSNLLTSGRAEDARVRPRVPTFVPRSCAETFGLAEAAAKAAKRWEFTPGTKDGVAVPVLVEIEMTFTLR
jgi:hypothetical protein